MRVTLLATTVAGLTAAAGPTSPRFEARLRVDAVVATPDTLALEYVDRGLMSATCLNQHGDSVFCTGGLSWIVRDTTKVLPIRTTAPQAEAVPKAAGTTWAVVIGGSGRGRDSVKIVVLSGPPAPIPPTPPESAFVAFNLDTVRLDSGATDTTLLARTYRNAGHTILTLGRTVNTTSTNAPSATASPTSGLSTLRVAVTGVRPGAARIIATPSLFGRRDTAVVIVRAVVDTTTPPDTTTIPVARCPTGAPAILVGENVQARINAYPGGTTFCMPAGVYRYATALPKANDTIIGEDGAILTGARVLTGWTASGAYWYVGGQTQENTAIGTSPCAVGHPGCSYPEQLWVDDTLYEHMTTLGAVTPGAKTWFFDYPADRIYVGVNPSGRTIETSVTVYAFGGPASGVTLKNLTVKRYATGSQSAAVGYGSAPGWTVESLVVREGHGIGIRTGSGSTQRWNHVVKQGQLGISAVGSNVLIYGNTIDSSMTAYFGSGSAVECGGSKFVVTTGLVVRQNLFRWNGCDGLWLDVNNRGATIDTNTVLDGACSGIVDEVGYNSIIRGNDVRRNGLACTLGSTAVSPSGIMIANSRDAEVVDNTVIGNLHGITAVETARSAPPIPSGYGSHDVVNLWVHGNFVTQTTSGRAAGIVDTDAGADPFSVAANNDWTGNTYTLGALTRFRWATTTDKTWAAWRAAGQDVGSTETGQ